jgi:hypothetical protein
MADTEIGYVAAEPGEVHWHYNVPTDRNSKMTLLTRGGLQVTGNWIGDWGDFFLAWAPLLKRDKEREAYLLGSTRHGISIAQANCEYDMLTSRENR